MSQAKKRVVIIGSGWGGYLFARRLDAQKFKTILISPRNHFVFTPMLPSAAVGTLEYNCIQEPVRTIPNINYYQAKAQMLDVSNQVLSCEDYYERSSFDVPYDYLVVAAGAKTNTFNTPGVEYGKNNLYFLKELAHARAIRQRVVECFERASYPGEDVTEDIKRQLLSFVIVGGGPISVEYAGELHDFLTRDLSKWYPELMQYVQVHLVEASKHILGPFNPELQDYAETLLLKRKFDLRTGVAVKEVRDKEVELTDGSIIPCGLVVWSTGIAPTKFTQTLHDQKDQFTVWNGRLLMDDRLRLLRPGKAQGESYLQPHANIFGIGDCAVCSSTPLPTLGYVAKKQGAYLAKNFNSGAMENPKKPFKFLALLQMTQIGGGAAIVDTSPGPAQGYASMTGFVGQIVWKFSYWGMQVSTANKLLIPMFWLKAALFGRNTSRY